MRVTGGGGGGGSSSTQFLGPLAVVPSIMQVKSCFSVRVSNICDDHATPCECGGREGGRERRKVERERRLVWNERQKWVLGYTDEAVCVAL